MKIKAALLFGVSLFATAGVRGAVDQLTVTVDLVLPGTINVGTQLTHLATTLDLPNGLERTVTNSVIVHNGGRLNLNGGSLGNGTGSTGFITVRSGGRFFLDDSGSVNRPSDFTVDGGEFVMEFGSLTGTLRVQEDSLADGNPTRGVATIFDGNVNGQIVLQGGTFLDITGGVFAPAPFTFSLQALGSNNTVNIAGSNIIDHIFFESFGSASDLIIFQGDNFALNDVPVTMDDVVFSEGVYFIEARSTSGNPLVLSGTLLDDTEFSFELPRLVDAEVAFAISAIPEPATYGVFAALLMGLVCAMARRRSVK